MKMTITVNISSDKELEESLRKDWDTQDKIKALDKRADEMASAFLFIQNELDADTQSMINGVFEYLSKLTVDREYFVDELVAACERLRG